MIKLVRIYEAQHANGKLSVERPGRQRQCFEFDSGPGAFQFCPVTINRCDIGKYIRLETEQARVGADLTMQTAV